jgi:hypothetical protein
MTLDSTPKSIFRSVTFWGAVLGVLTMAFPAFFTKLGVTDANSVAISQHIVDIIAFIVVVWGRLHASQVVTLTGNPPKPPAIKP